MAQKTSKKKKPLRRTPRAPELLDGPAQNPDSIFRTQRGQGPLWEGPVGEGPQGGLTFSLLSKWLVCRDRFRLKVVEGVEEPMGFNPAIEFGSLWHEAEEAHSGGKDWKRAMSAYHQKLLKLFPTQTDEVRRQFLTAKAVFPVYIRHWAGHSMEKKRKPLMEEVSFRVPYRLPSGRDIVLRGKFDCVLATGKSIWLQEHKTKGRIDEQGIQATVAENLQTMIYQTALRASLRRDGDVPELHPVHGTDMVVECPKGARMAGVLYNVIRRPLGDPFGPGTIRQRKTETEGQFYKRLAEKVQELESKFFYRWKVSLTQTDMADFHREVLHPILESFLDWWTWITLDPAHPFRLPTRMDLEQTPATRGLRGGGLHWRSPWGVYNSLGQGFRGDYFDYLTQGRTSALEPIHTLFPEL